jgi:hypothetical protein
MKLQIRYKQYKNVKLAIFYFILAFILLAFNTYLYFFTFAKATDRLYSFGIVLIPTVLFILMASRRLKEKDITQIIDCDSYKNLDEIEYPKYQKEE